MAAPIVVGVLLGLVLATPPAAATQTFPGPPSIEHLAHRADLIVVGEVLAATGEWDAARTNIHTRIELSVAEWLKGAASSPVTFTQLGGRVGGEASLVGGAVTFQPGQRVLLFLTRRPDGSLGLTDLANGACDTRAHHSFRRSDNRRWR